MYIQICYDEPMKAERFREDERRVLEHDIREALRRKRAAEELGNLTRVAIHETDMNEALDEYSDLVKAEQT